MANWTQSTYPGAVVNGAYERSLLAVQAEAPSPLARRRPVDVHGAEYGETYGVSAGKLLRAVSQDLTRPRNGRGRRSVAPESSGAPARVREAAGGNA